MEKSKNLTALWQDCEFVVNSRLHLARNFIFDKNNRFRSSQKKWK
jgi:hypothetical protein